MKWIVNCLLDVIIFLWSMWVCAWRRASLDAPFRKWFIKCKNAKKKSGRIIWKEFFAIMKYLTLHYIQRHGEAEKYYEYESYVDMTPFTYENRGRYTEDDWDMLVGMQYGLYEQPQTNLPNNKKSNVQEQIDVKKELSSRQMEEPVHAEQVINNQIENAIPVQPEESLQQEQPTYIEEEEKSKTWLYVLLAVLIGGAIWYFFINDSEKSTSNDNANPVEMTDNTSEEVIDNTPVENEEEVEASTPLAFLEQFYKGNLNDADYVKQHVTANVLNKLKRDYKSKCPSGNCLATWVFTAYPPGSDLELEEGPIIANDSETGKYSVLYKYYSQRQSGRIYKHRGLLISVTEIDGKYLISDYELAMPDIVQNQDDLSNNSDGQYYLRDGRLFLHLIKEGQKIEADFNFRDGTYVSATYDFSCIINNENKFCTDVYKNGKKMGMIEGTFEDGVIKVDVGVDNKYSGSYELKVNQNE